MIWFLILMNILFAPVVMAQMGSSPDPRADSVAAFLQSREEKERAFSYLLPFGWLTAGGVVRRDPLAPSANPLAVAPQLDFTVQRDSSGHALIRWMPNVMYCDLRRTHVHGSDVFPVGSTYQGMLVYPLMSAEDFLVKFKIPAVHPTATTIRFLSQQRLPSLAKAYTKLLRDTPGKLTFKYDAATATLLYDEGGVSYQERWLTVIENWGEVGGGQWSNKETVFFRAPIEEFNSLVPVFEIVYGSITPNPMWVAAEAPHDSAQSGIGLKTRREDRDSPHRMMRHRTKISQEIRSALFGSSGELAVFVNPFTGEAERCPSAWHFRWVNSSADVLYCNDSGYTPDGDVRFMASGFRRCESLADSLHPAKISPASLGDK